MEYITTLSRDNLEVALNSKYPGLKFTSPIEYYDFHIYYYAHNDESQEESDLLRRKLLKEFFEEAENGSIIVKVLPDSKVIGPHSTQFWEVDVVRPEVFLSLLTWFQLHHGNLSVLIHPQTGNDIKDHTLHALWLGHRLPVLLNKLRTTNAQVPPFGGTHTKNTNEYENFHAQKHKMK
ncbi:Piso0_000656 [Millerozyma farinosa CBS 7064]|uniref:Piso0_000656 protein n=1 Tax=Pichia sorbitophila (strain ATCC MYA-4447 / BCRC 22081 / CBS 7064 / NBRC 10061 / NRRL Y-12695) TaxID=559304 RepID=G8YR56_PICSO|nr:Piso0_000656 [Millerozyma farinosa CBS 7064]